jgi:hypothetical protein
MDKHVANECRAPVFPLDTVAAMMDKVSNRKTLPYLPAILYGYLP